MAVHQHLEQRSGGADSLEEAGGPPCPIQQDQKSVDRRLVFLGGAVPSSGASNLAMVGECRHYTEEIGKKMEDLQFENSSLKKENKKMEKEIHEARLKAAHESEKKELEMKLARKESELALAQKDKELVAAQKDKEILAAQKDKEIMAAEKDKEIVVAKKEKEIVMAEKDKEIVAAQKDKEVITAQKDKEIVAAQKDKEVILAQKDKEVVAAMFGGAIAAQKDGKLDKNVQPSNVPNKTNEKKEKAENNEKT